MDKVFIFCFLLVSIVANSQTLNDAIIFGQDQKIGNARFTSMGGSFGALGGNSSAARINAASIGVYRKGVFNTSLGISSQGMNASHYGNSTTDLLTSGRLTNLTLAFSNPLYDNDWVKFNVLFSYNRRNNYDSQYNIQGVNNESSKLDRYLYDILEEPVYIEDLYDLFPFGAGMAWGSELIDTANGSYFHNLESYGHEQRLQSRTKGGVGDYIAGIGANYNDRLYMGATVGIASLNYSLVSTYSETPTSSNTNTFLTDWHETTKLDISGRGFSLSLGLIYWLREKMRIGLAYNSGTKYRITESFKKEMVANWNDRDQTFANSPEGFNEYTYKSPYNVTASFALVDKYIGSVNLDAELVTYGRMKFDKVAGYPVDFTEVNNELKNDIGPSVNLRLGGEFLLGSVLLRAGGGLLGNPIKGKEFFNRYSISGGIGYRIKRVTVDFAYSYFTSNPYNTNIHYAKEIRLEPSKVAVFSHQFVFSVGFKFKELD